MGLLDRFRGNRQQSVLPDEVRQYYQAEQKQRRGVAIGLAILALIVTIAIASALFFGGRAIYRSVKDDDNKGQTSSTATDNSDKQNNPSSGDDQEQKPQDKPATNNTTPTNPTTPNTTQTPNATTTPNTTPSLGDEPASLPRTGDEGM